LKVISDEVILGKMPVVNGKAKRMKKNMKQEPFNVYIIVPPIVILLLILVTPRFELIFLD
jgi:hypothetical protein